MHNTSAFQLISLPLLLTVFAVLMVASGVLSGASQRVGVPVVLTFLVLGAAAGQSGLAEILTQDYRFYFNFGTVALVLILFDGGLNTPLTLISRDLVPAILLATIGVAGTATLTALLARLFDFSWTHAFLLGAIVAPTDAAAVLAMLRTSGLQLKKRISSVLELESGLNDPMAVVLTVALSERLAQHRGATLGTFVFIPAALVIGAVLGIAVGYSGRVLLLRLRLPAGGLYPMITLALALFAFGLPTFLLGSGFLAVYVAAAVLLILE